jgi:uncharacterized membrane-anchored protein YjiN (DUF445 family)
VLMAIVFVSAKILEKDYHALAFVRAFAEAAMIGALADWFAVSALFRHPFGLPIPHTAIIPRNKDRIGASVADFLEHNFMTREVISEELRHIDFTGVAAHWLGQPQNSRAVAAQIVSGIPALLRMVEDEDVDRFMQGRIASALNRVRFAPLLAEILSVLVADGRHQALFDRTLQIVAHGLEQNKSRIREKIHERSPRWIPKSLDERFFLRLLEELHNVLEEMKSEESEWRARFQTLLEDWIAKLRTSPEVEAQIAAMIRATFAHPLFRDYTAQVWQDMRQRLLDDAVAADSRAVALLDQAISAFSVALAQDQAVRSKLNNWIAGFATHTIVAQRHTIAGLIRRVIQQWDADTVSRKFELYVGKDLQYIRINGTLVGGMVGLLLYVFSLAL